MMAMSSRQAVFLILVCLAVIPISVALSSAPLEKPNRTPVPTTTVGTRSSSSSFKAHFTAKIAHSIAKGERRAQERAVQAREACARCARPPCLCLCDIVPATPLVTQTHILILQHPNERRKRNLSTVPLIRLVLQHVQIVVGYSFEMSVLAQQYPPLHDLLEQGRQPLLLYPSPNAISLDETHGSNLKHSSNGQAFRLDGTDNLATSNIDTSTNTNNTVGNVLILVDGTWSEAKRMVRDSPSLVDHCQHLQFRSSDTKSVYDAIRKEPDDHCLSTLEACAKALQYLEPTAHEVPTYLDAVLRAHVDSHLENAKHMKPRSVRKACNSLYEKNKRRREIELEWIQRRQQLQQGSQLQQSTPVVSGSVELPDGAVMRPLKVEDAPLIDSRWEFHSDKSLSLVTRRIVLDGGVASWGVDVTDNGQRKLVASIIRYEDGPLGMLHVVDAYRRRGYASALLRHVTQSLLERGEDCVAFIVDGNSASEALFASQGWERADPSSKKGTGKRRAKRRWVLRT